MSVWAKGVMVGDGPIAAGLDRPLDELWNPVVTVPCVTAARSGLSVLQPSEPNGLDAVVRRTGGWVGP